MLSFEKQFNSFYPTLKMISARYARGTSIPVAEFESSLSEEFFLKYDLFDPERKDNFSAFMRVVLTQRASRVANRKEKKYYDNVVFYEDTKENDQGEEVEFDLPSDYNLEKDVIQRAERKTDADKLELINALSENADSITKDIIQEYLRGEHARPTAIGKAIGVHNMTVERKLKSLSKNFTGKSRYEIDAYLVV